MTKDNETNLIKFIAIITTIGVALLMVGVGLMYSLFGQISDLNAGFTKHQLDYVEHKAITQKDIEALQRKE